MDNNHIWANVPNPNQHPIQEQAEDVLKPVAMHEVSYVFADGYDTVTEVINRMTDLGYNYGYKELRMADGVVHSFCVRGEDWLELPDMEAVLKWLCSDIYLLKDAYDSGIVRKKVTNA